MLRRRLNFGRTQNKKTNWSIHQSSLLFSQTQCQISGTYLTDEFKVHAAIMNICLDWYNNYYQVLQFTVCLKLDSDLSIILVILKFAHHQSAFVSICSFILSINIIPVVSVISNNSTIFWWCLVIKKLASKR